MANHLTVAICALSVFVFVKADYDAAFCMKHLVKKSKETTFPKPTFPDNFHLYTEMKDKYVNVSIYYDEYYSMEHDVAFFKMTSATKSEKIWVFGKTDELIKGPENDVCEEEELENSTLASFLGVVDTDGKITLNKPEKSLHWNYGTKRLEYIGKDILSDRGIPVVLYKSCEYWDKMDATSVTSWFFSDPSNVTMPGRGKEMVLLAAEVLGNNGKGSTPQYNIRYDFTRYTTGITPTDKHFELPAENLCTNRPDAQASDHPLPSIPGDFFFQGEHTEIDKTGEVPFPVIHKVGEAFISDFNMSVSRKEGMKMGGNPDTAKTIDVEVSDFENGLKYFINMVDGSCVVDKIDADDAASVDVGNGKLRMRTARGFFDLDSDKYEYMGVHRHIERGIDCDVWSAYFSDDHMPNALYTWYFANAEWMAKNNLQYENPFPVQHVITTPEKIISMNMFEFTRNVKFHLPDVSSCFNSALENNVRFTLIGRYDHVVVPHLLEFRGALMTSILSVTGLKSVIRISELEIYPMEGDTVVEFKLLDKWPEQGDADTQIHIKTNKEAIKSLKTAIETGKFAVLIPIFDGEIKMDALKNSFQIIEPGYRPQAGGNPVNPKNNGDTGKSGSNNKIYSEGEMAGLAVGMIVLTAGIILLAGFILWRLRKPQTEECVTMDNINYKADR